VLQYIAVVDRAIGSAPRMIVVGIPDLLCSPIFSTGFYG